MTAVVTGNPWEFTATTEGDSVVGPLYINFLILTTSAAAGNIELLTAAGGRSLTGPLPMGVSDREIIYVRDYVDGVYVQTLPAGAEVHVYIGKGPR